MKLKNVGIILFLTLLLAACGDEKTTVSSEGSKDQSGEENTAAEEKEGTAKLEISQQTAGAWIDSIDSVWVHSAAIFENTGDTPVEIGETQMNYKATDGSILGTSSMIYAVPQIVNPGETAFIGESTILDGTLTDESFSETTFNFNFSETADKPNLMETSGIKGIDGEYGYKVTGIVKNPTTEQQEDIRLAAALFDNNGDLLGVLQGSVDVGLAAGSEAGFELSYPELPEGVAAKVATIEVKSYGWTW